MQSSNKSLTPTVLIRIFAACFVFMVITHPGLWVAFANGYSNDYLFNLTTGQIFGLVVITTSLLLLLFLLCTVSSYLLSQRLITVLPHWLVVLSCIVLALLLCAVALVLVPQLHYQYYRWIIPGLPAQWVPFGELSPPKLEQYIFLPADGNTTDHAKGGAVWICVCASAWVAYKYGQSDSDSQQ